MGVKVIVGENGVNICATLENDGTTYTTSDYEITKLEITKLERYDAYYYAYTNALVNSIQYKFNNLSYNISTQQRCYPQFFYNSNSLYIGFGGSSNKSLVTVIAKILNKNNQLVSQLKQKSITMSTVDSKTTFTFYNDNNGKGNNIGTVTYNKDENSFTAENDANDEKTNYQNLAIIASAGFGDNFYLNENKDPNVVKAMYAISAAVINYI
jgi:uncharacterized protein YkuJ